jgi:hypothetical protein
MEDETLKKGDGDLAGRWGSGVSWVVALYSVGGA